MFRHRARSDLPPLDGPTAERILDGASVDEVPDSYRRVAELLAIVSRPATRGELEGAAAAAAAFVAAHDAANRPKPRTRPVAAMAFTTVLFAASTGTAVAATEGALPQPVQAVAHEALGVVGISVPDITEQRPDPTMDTPTGGSTTPTPGAGGVGAAEPHGTTQGVPPTNHAGVDAAEVAGDPTTAPAGTADPEVVTGGDGAESPAPSPPDPDPQPVAPHDAEHGPAEQPGPTEKPGPTDEAE